MNFYLVTTKCGYVGKKAYMPITFPIKAENGKEAAKMARRFPRVKRNHKDAILSCRKVDEFSFKIQFIINNNDPYLKATSKQEQEKTVIGIKERIKKDNHQEEMNQLTRRSSRPNLMYQQKKYYSEQSLY